MLTRFRIFTHSATITDKLSSSAHELKYCSTNFTEMFFDRNAHTLAEMFEYVECVVRFWLAFKTTYTDPSSVMWTNMLACTLTHGEDKDGMKRRRWRCAIPDFFPWENMQDTPILKDLQMMFIFSMGNPLLGEFIGILFRFWWFAKQSPCIFDGKQNTKIQQKYVPFNQSIDRRMGRSIYADVKSVETFASSGD